MPILVNGERIEDDSIDEDARTILLRLREASPEADESLLAAQAREWARENLIEKALVRQAGVPAPELIHAGHIVRNVDEFTAEENAFAAIRGAQQELERGTSFEETATRWSDCPDGGDLGFFARGEMVPEFERIVFSLGPGEVSDIFRTPFGFHIAKLYERREPKPFDEWVDQLRASATIVEAGS